MIMRLLKKLILRNMLIPLDIDMKVRRFIPYPKLLMWIVMGILISIIVTSFFTIHSITLIMQESIQKQGLSTSEGLANAVAENIIIKNYAGLEENIRQSFSNEDVISVSITDTGGKVLSSLSKDNVGDPAKLNFSKDFIEIPKGEDRLFSPNQATLVYWSPIIRGINLGWVKIEYSKPKNLEVLQDIDINGLVASFLSIGIFSIIALIKLRDYFIDVNGIHIKLSAENSQNGKEVISSHLMMMESLGIMTAKRDSETGAHNYRVTYVAVCLSEEMKLDNDAMQSMIAGSFLHDIGKVAIPDSILLKPGQLSADEWKVMKTHVDHGAQMVKKLGWLSTAYDVVANHHERWGGTGYPRGISGNDIPLSARIFMLADTFDALCSKRPYKTAFTYEESMNIIEQETPSHFDPETVSIFKKISLNIYQKLSQIHESEIKKLLNEKINHYFFVN